VPEPTKHFLYTRLGKTKETKKIVLFVFLKQNCLRLVLLDKTVRIFKIGVSFLLSLAGDSLR
jgi:hypothetical protein